MEALLLVKLTITTDPFTSVADFSFSTSRPCNSLKQHSQMVNATHYVDAYTHCGPTFVIKKRDKKAIKKKTESTYNSLSSVVVRVFMSVIKI